MSLPPTARWSTTPSGVPEEEVEKRKLTGECTKCGRAGHLRRIVGPDGGMRRGERLEPAVNLVEWKRKRPTSQHRNLA